MNSGTVFSPPDFFPDVSSFSSPLFIWENACELVTSDPTGIFSPFSLTVRHISVFFRLTAYSIRILFFPPLSKLSIPSYPSPHSRMRGYPRWSLRRGDFLHGLFLLPVR